MSEFVAGAFVDVKPETKGFRADLKRQLDAAIRNSGTFKIPVELDPKRFKSTVNAAAKASPAKIPIVPGTSVADLRKAINEKITKATTGLKINVPVEVQSTGAAAGGAAAGGAGAATTATTGAVAAKTSLTAASKKLTDTEKAEIVVARALKKAQDELAIANSLVALSNEGGITAEERKQRLGEAHAATTRSAAAANKVLAISEAELAVAQSDSLTTAREEALILRSQVTEKQKSLAINTAQATAETRSAKARQEAVTAMSVEVKSIKTLNDLHLVENELLALEARLKAQTTRARELGVTAAVRENERLLAQIALRKEAIVTQRDFLKGESVAARQQRTAARGAASTALSLFGVRGATLAASSAFLAGAVSAALFAKAISSFAKLETELNVFQATTGATAEQMQKVSKAAISLGRDLSLPGVSASDAASAMSELARAGLTVEDSIAGAKGVLQLASAAQISFADAATLTATALNAFGLAGDKAIHVADLLANAANASQGSISEMGAAMAQATAIARQVGFTLEDTFAILTEFARNGLRGSDAGTSLRTALSRLIAPTKKASDLIAALGLNLRDANGNLRSDIFVQFGEATKNLTPALRDMIAETIGGQDAIRAFSIGAREGAKGLKLAQLQMAATGTAAQLAAARAKGFAGDLAALQSNAETLGTSLGKITVGPLADFVGGLNQIITDLGLLTSGDFGSFFRNLSNEFKGMGEGAIQSGKDVNTFLEGITELDPGKAGRGLKDLLKGGLLQAPKDEKKEIQSLMEELTNLQQIRVQAFQAGFNIQPLTDKIKALQAQLRQARVDAGEIIPVTKLEKQLAPLQQIYDRAVLVRKALQDRGESTTFIDQTINDVLQKMNTLNIKAAQNAKKIRDNIKKTTSGTGLAKSFNAEFALIAQSPELATPEVLGSIDDLIRKIKGKAPLAGAASKTIGENILKNINEAIKAAVEADNPDLAAQLKKFADKIAALFSGSLGVAFKNIKVPLTDDELEAALLPAQIRTARAEAFGTVSEQISGKQNELDQLNDQLKKVVKGSTQEKKVLDDISAKKSEIRSLREGEAQKEKDANAKSDQKVADLLSDEERGLNQGLQKAQASETLKDDIKRQLALRSFFVRQIATLKATIKDAETRKSAVDEAESKLFSIEQDIAASRRGRRAQIRDARLGPIDDAADKASETETLKDDLKQAKRKVHFWRTQVKNVRELVRQRQATADELKEANDALDEAEANARQVRRDRREQIRDFKQQGLELDIEFAQTTENKSKEIKARQAFIAWLEQQKKTFKGNVNKLKELRNEIAAQKKALNELKGDASESKGTTVFELLKQAADVFRENAGNAITPDQPFAGPTGFVSNIANFIRRQQRKAATGALAPPPAAKPSVVKRPLDKVKGLSVTQPTLTGAVIPLEFSTAAESTSDRNRASVERLTTSVNRLANVIERQPGTGRANVKKATVPAGVERSERNHFSIATATRRVVENRGSI